MKGSCVLFDEIIKYLFLKDLFLKGGLPYRLCFANNFCLRFLMLKCFILDYLRYILGRIIKHHLKSHVSTQLKVIFSMFYVDILLLQAKSKRFTLSSSNSQGLCVFNLYFSTFSRPVFG